MHHLNYSIKTPKGIEMKKAIKLTTDHYLLMENVCLVTFAEIYNYDMTKTECIQIENDLCSNNGSYGLIVTTPNANLEEKKIVVEINEYHRIKREICEFLEINEKTVPYKEVDEVANEKEEVQA